MQVQLASHEWFETQNHNQYQTGAYGICTSNGHSLQLHDLGNSFLALHHQHRLHNKHAINIHHSDGSLL